MSDELKNVLEDVKDKFDTVIGAFNINSNFYPLDREKILSLLYPFNTL